jgi:hypothetical protein
VGKKHYPVDGTIAVGDIVSNRINGYEALVLEILPQECAKLLLLSPATQTNRVVTWMLFGFSVKVKAE